MYLVVDLFQFLPWIVPSIAFCSPCWRICFIPVKSRFFNWIISIVFFFLSTLLSICPLVSFSIQLIRFNFYQNPISKAWTFSLLKLHVLPRNTVLLIDQRERTDGGVEEEVGLNNTSPNDDNRNNNANYDKESHHASSATYDSSNSRNNSEIINNDFSAPDNLEHQSSSSSSFNGNYWNSRDTADYNRHCEPLPPAKVVDYQHQDPSNLRLHNRTNCTTSRDYFHQSDSVNVQNASGDYYGGGPPATSAAAAAANHQDSLMRAAPLPPFEADRSFTIMFVFPFFTFRYRLVTSINYHISSITSKIFIIIYTLHTD